MADPGTPDRPAGPRPGGAPPPHRAPTPAEAASVDRLLRSTRRVVYGATAFMALAAVALTAATLSVSTGVGVVTGLVAGAFAAATPWVVGRGTRDARTTGEVVRLSGPLTRALATEGLHSHRVGPRKASFPDEWAPYVDLGDEVEVEAVRVEVAGGDDVFFVVSTGGGLSVEAEGGAVGVPVPRVLGAVVGAAVAGPAFAVSVAFRGVGPVPADPAFSAAALAVSAAALAVYLVAVVPLWRADYRRARRYADGGVGGAAPAGAWWARRARFVAALTAPAAALTALVGGLAGFPVGLSALCGAVMALPVFAIGPGQRSGDL